MARNKQESNSAYYEMAKEIAKVERELGMERWVRLEILMETGRTEHGAEEQRMAFYDFPVEVYLRREWVIRWRAARIQCQHPRNTVRTFSDYYRRMKGNDLGMQADIDKFTRAKASVTIQKKNVEAYIARQREDMFWQEENDQKLKNVRERLTKAEQSVAEAEQRLIQKVEEYQRQHQKEGEAAA